MSGNIKKRRDKKGRVLRNGESQRPDGRYSFTYYEGGKQRTFYSWKLEKRDCIPSGKRNCLSLREKEDLLRQDQFDGIHRDFQLTVRQLINRFVTQHAISSDNTKEVLNVCVSIICKTPYINRKTNDFLKSDAKSMIKMLQTDYGYTYGTITSVHSVMKQAFQMLVEDDIIRKNPFAFRISDVIINDTHHIEALTREQEKEYLTFIKNDPLFQKYYPAIYLLFHTGMRISEMCALTVSDIDFDAGYINIDKQVIKIHGRLPYISTPKTNVSYRQIPITDDVACALKDILSSRTSRDELAVAYDKDKKNNYTGFLFTSKLKHSDIPVCTNYMTWGSTFRRIYKKFIEQRRKKDHFPVVTPHVARHTYSSLRGALLPTKIHMQVMGHSNPSVTYGVYTHNENELAKKIVLSLINENDYIE